MYVDGINFLGNLLGCGTPGLGSTVPGMDFSNVLKGVLASQSSDSRSGYTTENTAKTGKSSSCSVYRGIGFDPKKPVYVVKIREAAEPVTDTGQNTETTAQDSAEDRIEWLNNVKALMQWQYAGRSLGNYLGYGNVWNSLW